MRNKVLAPLYPGLGWTQRGWQWQRRWNTRDPDQISLHAKHWRYAVEERNPPWIVLLVSPTDYRLNDALVAELAQLRNAFRQCLLHPLCLQGKAESALFTRIEGHLGNSPLMDRSALVRLVGFPATLVHGDHLVLDRWFWLKARLPKTRNDERLLDVGCGSGAFSIGAALRGYRALGLSWGERNQSVAKERAIYCKAPSAQFEVLDIRELARRADLVGALT